MRTRQLRRARNLAYPSICAQKVVTLLDFTLAIGWKRERAIRVTLLCNGGFASNMLANTAGLQKTTF
jgi:hypothetical protein